MGELELFVSLADLVSLVLSKKDDKKDKISFIHLLRGVQAQSNNTDKRV